jgi:PTH2 family peptidyl-tRNA hydrolase
MSAMAKDFKYKQVIVVRAELDLSRGKWCAQAAHASVMAAEEARKRHRLWYRKWLEGGQKKVILQVPSLKELQLLKALAEKMEMPSAMVVDYGLTEVAPGTVTCVGFGPAPGEAVDRITGSLPLFR